jgi:hypothetical protein
VNNISLNPKETVETALGHKTLSSGDMKESLFNYCIDMDAICFGLSATDVRLLCVFYKE